LGYFNYGPEKLKFFSGKFTRLWALWHRVHQFSLSTEGEKTSGFPAHNLNNPKCGLVSDKKKSLKKLQFFRPLGACLRQKNFPCPLAQSAVVIIKITTALCAKGQGKFFVGDPL
jgi:hypothetical protein